MKRILSSILLISMVTMIFLSAWPPDMTAAEPQPPFADSVSGQLLPLLQARGAILVDADTGKTIFSVNEQERLYPASTTKILTALLAIEQGDLDERVTVGDEIYLAPADSSKAGLMKGQVLSLKNLVYALMLPSGNDAALTIAVHIGRKTRPGEALSIQQALNGFIEMMNQRAQQLGAVHSHFSNPDGYHDDKHFSTPADMAMIARQAMLSPFLRQVVSTSIYPTASGQHAASGTWVNTNELLRTNDPFFMQEATGIKTGHTREAGYCLVSSATRGDAHLLAVVLNSTPTGVYTDSIHLLKYGFVHYPPHTPLPPEGDLDYPYAEKASTIYIIVLLCAGIYAATRVIEARVRHREKATVGQEFTSA
ncbi:MAG TPA: D-alanyl-D-alanine carboxypeptidase family protein [Syntrophomonadaceae bacterium]|nr:D-alanyl-D-alanine carboxypeptidase family protein [Syntrophomonadaceae bacterium]